MCAAEARELQQYGTIVVVGGGCYGSYYVRQLERAKAAGAITAERIVVVDRDAACMVSQQPLPGVELVVADWRAFFADYLAAAADRPSDFERDAIVPSPLMPHLMGEWITTRARARFPARDVTAVPFERIPPVPWERAGADGTHYVSFATWMCPVNCVEPRICPHTRDLRSWSMPVALAEYAKGGSPSVSAPAAAKPAPPTVIAVLHCRHRAYGVGMFDTLEVVDADARVTAVAEQGPAEIIIGTVSHCHGALTRLLISGTETPRDSHFA